MKGMSLLVHSYLVKNPVEFPQILSQAKATAASANAELYLLFVGTKSTSTGKSWCGDCVRAEPVLEDALAKHSQAFVLVSCDVDREPYRTPQYVYRTDPLVNLRSGYSLFQFGKVKEVTPGD